MARSAVEEISQPEVKPRFGKNLLNGCYPEVGLVAVIILLMPFIQVALIAYNGHNIHNESQESFSFSTFEQTSMDVIPLGDKIAMILSSLASLLASVLVLGARRHLWYLAYGVFFVSMVLAFQTKAVSLDMSGGWILVSCWGLCALLLVGLFRYPFVERRDQWNGKDPRVITRLSLELKDGSGGSSRIVLENLSLGGGLLRLESSAKTFQKGDHVTLVFPGETLRVARIVRVHDLRLGVEWV